MKIEDVSLWLRSEVTKEFLSIIAIHKQDVDKFVHIALRKGEFQQAASHNAALIQLKEVLNIPENIKENIKMEEEDET